MSQRYDCTDPDEREAGLKAAVDATRDGELVVIPTDTVYGIAADAFDPGSVRRLLAAKGRGREMPPPVLVSARSTLDALASAISDDARAFAEAFWPGPLTLVCRQQPSLRWDLGDTRGTVAVRMPDHDLAVELLARTGPLAVSSANRTGLPAATSVDAAEEMLESAVEIYLDAGEAPGGVASTIVDVTGEVPRVLRAGALSLEQLREVVETTEDAG
ncbi:MAG: threonylcarbamoyl-AMP synthase [Propionibacteriales bacterium]|nr:threonylcarbamoyl-AMP synthase [Propionibacteriales bacterium]